MPDLIQAFFLCFCKILITANTKYKGRFNALYTMLYSDINPSLAEELILNKA